MAMAMVMAMMQRELEKQNYQIKEWKRDSGKD